jgi:hypothetical protein
MSEPTRFRPRWRIRWFDETGRRGATELELPTKDRTCGELFAYWLGHPAPSKCSGSITSVSLVAICDRRSHLLARERPLSTSNRTLPAGARLHLYPKTIADQLTPLVLMLNMAKNELRCVESLLRIRKPKAPRDAEEYWIPANTRPERPILNAGSAEMTTAASASLRASRRQSFLDGAGLEQIGSDFLRKRWPVRCAGVRGLRAFDDEFDRNSISMGMDMWRLKTPMSAGALVRAIVKDTDKLRHRPVPSPQS